VAVDGGRGTIPVLSAGLKADLVRGVGLSRTLGAACFLWFPEVGETIGGQGR